MFDKFRNSNPQPDRLPDFERPAAYNIPFPWGNFQVSAAAHDAYQLQPLRPDVEPGSFDQGRQVPLKPRTDIVLVTPEESKAPKLEQLNGNVLAMGLQVAANKNGVALAATFSHTIQALKESQLKTLEQKTGEGADALVEVPGIGDVRVEEALDQHLPDAYAHKLSDGLHVGISKAFAGYAEARANASVISTLRTANIGGLAVAGGINGAEIILQNDLRPSTAIFGIAVMGFSNLLASRNVVRHLQTAPDRQMFLEATAGLMAGKIREDIHQTFCRNRFDSQMNQSLFED